MRHRPEVVGRSNPQPQPQPQGGWPPAAVRHAATSGLSRDGYALSGLWLWITSQLHPQCGSTR